MVPPIAYDLTRLVRGLYSSTPNGIDRVDLCFARHYLGSAQYDRTAIILNGLRPWCIEAGAAVAALARIEAQWQEGAGIDDDDAFHSVRAAIIGGTAGERTMDHPQRVISRRAGRRRNMRGMIGAILPQLGHLLFSALPENSVLFHTTQFPFGSMFKWLRHRPDVKVVFFIHDLLPVRFPEFFTARNQDWHRRSLEVLVRHGSGAIVNGNAVKDDLRDFLARHEKPDLPILVAPIQADPAFSEHGPLDPELAARPYFVVCGTIEPRKNHLLLLNVWRELVRQEGPHAPKLVIIGKRGWKNENVLDMLERASGIVSHVIEVSGLSTPAMKHFMANARALLVPSFAEGYCLPMVEALALGTPVIASDIVVFREIGGERCVYRSPIDGRGWLDAIRAFGTAPAATRPAQAAVGEKPLPEYFAAVDAFISTLSK